MTSSTLYPTLAAFLADKIAQSGKSRDEIAAASSLPNARFLDLLIAGQLKLPFARVDALARSLDLDPVHLLRLTLREYAPDVLDALENALERPLLSAKEIALVEGFRALTGGSDAPSVVVERDGLLEVIVLPRSLASSTACEAPQGPV